MKILKGIGIVFLIGLVASGGAYLLISNCPDFNITTGQCSWLAKAAKEEWMARIECLKCNDGEMLFVSRDPDSYVNVKCSNCKTESGYVPGTLILIEPTMTEYPNGWYTRRRGIN